MINLAAEEKYNSKATKAYAIASLYLWAQEMKEGEGRANLLAILAQQAGGDGDESKPPGKLFSPRAAQADIILKDARLMEPRVAKVLVAKALGLSLADMAREFSSTKSQMQVEVEAAIGSFRMGLQYRRKG